MDPYVDRRNGLGRDVSTTCFINLFGLDGIGHGQVTHVGIVESVDGMT
jgi:hypothetical protein